MHHLYIESDFLTYWRYYRRDYANIYTQPVRTLFLFKSIWIRPQGPQGCQKMCQDSLNMPFEVWCANMGWRHFVDNDISWTLFFKMGDFSWTFPKGDFSWTLLMTSRGQFCPREFPFFGWLFVDIFGWILMDILGEFNSNDKHYIAIN